MVDRYIQRKSQVTTRTVIGSRHDLLTVAAVTVIGFAIVIFATRQIAGQSPHSILIRLDFMRIVCFSSAD